MAGVLGESNSLADSCGLNSPSTSLAKGGAEQCDDAPLIPRIAERNQGESMRSLEEEEELLRQHWEHMQDAQLEEEEELEYNAADDEYGGDWDDELWEEELWVEEEEIEKKRPKKE